MRSYLCYYSAMIRNFKKTVTGAGGIYEILIIAIPLILSTSANTVQIFVDRTFLSWYDTNAISAAMQAGVAAFTITSFFQGLIGYTNTFVAQYCGARRYDRVGHAVWQGIYMALIAGALILAFIPFSPLLFKLLGHNIAIRENEITYFNILCVNALPALCVIALSNFFTGRGKTKLVMHITLLTTIINIVLDYIMIFGKFGLPKMGVTGAGWATVIATTFAMILYVIVFFNAKYRKKFSTIIGAKPDIELFKRMIRFGLPSGIEFALVMINWTIFLTVAGRLGLIEMNATAIATQMISISFMPMMGVGIAITTLVGQRLGENRSELAEKTTHSAFFLMLTYMTVIAILLIAIPNILMFPFEMGANAEKFAILKPIAINLFILVAIHNLFAAGSMTYSAAIKGAGDTKFVMVASVCVDWCCVAIPSMLILKFIPNIYYVWSTLPVFAIVSSAVFFLRFKRGKWKSMRVIEKSPIVTMTSPSRRPDDALGKQIHELEQ